MKHFIKSTFALLILSLTAVLVNADPIDVFTDVDTTYATAEFTSTVPTNCSIKINSKGTLGFSQDNIKGDAVEFSIFSNANKYPIVYISDTDVRKSGVYNGGSTIKPHQIDFTISDKEVSDTKRLTLVSGKYQLNASYVYGIDGATAGDYKVTTVINVDCVN